MAAKMLRATLPRLQSAMPSASSRSVAGVSAVAPDEISKLGRFLPDEAFAADTTSWSGGTCSPPEEAASIGAGIGRLSNMVLEKGQGCWVWTENGEKYLDLATGIGVTSLGHCHPRVLKAIHEQVDKIWHAQVNISHHRPMLDLTQKLKACMPEGSGLDSFLFVTTGAEAVEAAVKLARHATGRPNIITFQGAYHGRTLLTMSMTTSKTIFRNRYGPHAAGIHVAPLPYFLRHHVPVEDPTALALDQLEVLMSQQSTPEETAAIVIEPILGEGGYVPPPPGFLEGLRAFCNKKGLLLIADEVQTGFGRTGKMFAVENFDVHPDILVFAKGIASGMPIAGIAARKALTDLQPAGSQGGTYAGNAVACAAAKATIDTIVDENILSNVQARGLQLMDGLRKIKEETGVPIADIRGLGLMVGCEFDDRAVEKGFAAKVSKAALARGVIVLPTGAYETLRIIPPLIVSEEEMAHGLDVLKSSMVEALSSEPVF
eukprot:TRINITY_DN21988_c0_g1_i1.p1 TRINITY_DN21988_c0_g1~~TRINITY_DN21988_c0_g1_i1.p1  ORF type:complete len:488 (-),score=135.57 TRINITY_DN21988_c0_g1_i1:381-1844(-)